jgi:hypothetical protein
MNWDDGNALHPVAILVFVAILFPEAGRTGAGRGPG